MPKAASLVPSLCQEAYEGSLESLFEVRGDAAAALEAYSAASQSGQTQRQEYNRLLLSYLASSPSSSDQITKQMDEWEDNWKLSEDYLSTRNNKQKLWKFIFAYNRSLIQFAAGKPRDAVGPLLDLLRPLVADQKSALRDSLLDASSRSAFLVLDCLLAISEARGLQELDEELTSESLVTWLDSLDFESSPCLKFLLSLYKSRLDFAARDQSGKMIDSAVKGVRKELKLAMEVLNHKLRPAITGSTGGETASVGSLSEVEDHSIHASDVPISRQETLLQGLNQSALNLKARLEQLKGNSKKSLVLCAEAHSSAYESTHFNNLAFVYAANGKRNLALHSCARSLRASSVAAEMFTFTSDGTASPEPTWSIVHNAAILAFQAGNYVSAYECMANCVQNSKEYSERPRCWLRMAEACIGIHVESKKQREKELNQTEFVAVVCNAEPKGILLNSSLIDTPLFVPQELDTALGSPDDLVQVRKQPLGRAFICLEQVIGLQHTEEIDKDCLESARCFLAYLKLELRDYQGASDLAMSILFENDEAFWREAGGLRERLHKQRLACARLYASEALSGLGNPASATQLISREQDSSFRNRLSVDLAGGILPNIDVNDVSKLIKAQIMVQTNASSVSASMGDLSVAEQLALSALQNSEQEHHRRTFKAGYATSARKALLFCMLREGNHEGALELLASAR